MQYSSPQVGRVSRLRASSRDAGDLANGMLEQGQTMTDAEEGYLDNGTTPPSVMPDATPSQ